MRDTTVTGANSIAGELRNIDDAVEQELGYVKSVLAAIELMADTDSHRYKLEIASLARCAHWIADNLEDNVSYMGERVVEMSKGVH
jgi:hypothetical protein